MTRNLHVDRIGVQVSRRGDDTEALAPGRTMPPAFEPVAGFRGTTACRAGRYTEFAAQVRRTGSGDAAVDGFEVRYTLDGEAYTERWSMRLVLCDEAGEHILAQCRP